MKMTETRFDFPKKSTNSLLLLSFLEKQNKFLLIFSLPLFRAKLS